MGDKNDHWSNGVGFLVAIVFFCITVYLQIRNGYARDESIYVANFIGNGLWFLLIGCVVCLLIFHNVSKIKHKKLSIMISSLTLSLLMIYGLLITLGWFISYHNVKT